MAPSENTVDADGRSRAAWPLTTTPSQIRDRLAEHGYLPDDGLLAAAFLAMRMHRPLFLEGEPGVGKTMFAHAMAEAFGAQLIRLQCHAGIDATQAVYDWNFPRQILTLRSTDPDAGTGIVPALYTEEFLIRRPILRALQDAPAVLLIDEIDRADDEFEALLLEVLEDNSVSIPELGTIRAAVPPLVVLTSNRTREVHDALKRRCLYHWISHPNAEREAEILHQRVLGLADGLAEAIASGLARVRKAGLTKAPGVAEGVDFAQALTETGAVALTAAGVDATISTIVKHPDDLAPMRAALLSEPARGEDQL